MSVFDVLKMLTPQMKRVLEIQEQISKSLHPADSKMLDHGCINNQEPLPQNICVQPPKIENNIQTGKPEFVFINHQHFSDFLHLIAINYEEESAYWNENAAQVGQVSDIYLPKSPPEGQSIISQKENKDSQKIDTLHLRVYYPSEKTNPAESSRKQDKSKQEIAPWIFFIHGGGYIVGSVKTHDHICRQLCWQSNLPVVSIDYTLSPTAKFPQALDQILDALEYLQYHALYLGLDPCRFALAGDSAGATMALTTQLRLTRQSKQQQTQQQESDPRKTTCKKQIPKAKVMLLFYGDFGLKDSMSRQLFGSELDWMGAEHFELYQRAYLNSPQDKYHPDFDLLRNDLTQVLVPTYLCSTNLDPLEDDSRLLEQLCLRNNIPVLHENYQGLLHAFLNFRRLLPQANQAMKTASDFARKYL